MAANLTRTLSLRPHHRTFLTCGEITNLFSLSYPFLSLPRFCYRVLSPGRTPVRVYISGNYNAQDPVVKGKGSRLDPGCHGQLRG